MALYNRQYWKGKILYHAIDCSKWNRRGDVMRMNPTSKMIDEFFGKFTNQIKKLEREGYLKRKGRRLVPIASRMHDSWVSLPLYGDRGYTFKTSDIIHARAVMKRNIKLFERLLDWNDIDKLIKLLRGRKVKRPTLTAHLIFAAWTFQRD